MIEIVVGDITALDVDAIVNAANSALSGGGGVDGAIHRAAGPELLQACRRIGRCPTGAAVITPGYRLKARWVIHAVGPVWSGGTAGEDRLLESTYRSALAIAQTRSDIRSVAFPAISTGAYRYPRERACRTALTVLAEAESRFDRLVACVYDREHAAMYSAILKEVMPL